MGSSNSRADFSKLAKKMKAQPKTILLEYDTIGTLQFVGNGRPAATSVPSPLSDAHREWLRLQTPEKSHDVVGDHRMRNYEKYLESFGATEVLDPSMDVLDRSGEI